MPQGLSVGRLIRVTINLSPLAPQRRSFGTLLAMGDSTVINTDERIRSYSTYDGVVADFGSNAPESKAAELYFSQVPKPRTFCVGRWARTATSGFVTGGALTTGEQTIGTWNLITTGAFKITVDGVLKSLTALDFSASASLNAVAAVITAAFSGSAVCTWSGSKFTITSATTGASSTMTYGIAPVSGTDLSPLLKITSALASTLVQGIAAETPAAAVAILANVSSAWYGVMFAASTMPTDDQAIDVAAFIEATSLARVYGVTSTDVRTLDISYTNDIASRMKALAYKRTFTQYSPNVYAVASFMGRAFSVNFNMNNSTITLMYKQEPGIVAEYLTETQAQTLKTKRCNVFVNYDNDTAIIQYGVMSGPAYFDEIQGTDWLQNAVQTEVYTLLYLSATKIPQTDAGSNQIVNAINNVMEQAVNNGLVGPGQWNADGFGQLQRGDFLKTGFYIYAQPMALQNQGDRDARIAPPITVAAKLAGAIQEADIQINVNR